jgi:tRNA A37 methylthiotransferase MiaB
MAIQQEIQRQVNRDLEGRTLEVLVEGLDRKRRISSGRSRCNRVVNIAGESALRPGTLVNVQIERGFPNSLLGRMKRIEEEDFLRKGSLERPSQRGDAESIVTGTF